MDCGDSQDYNFIIKLQYHYMKCSLNTCMRYGSIREVLKLSLSGWLSFEKRRDFLLIVSVRRGEEIVFICS